MALRRVTRYAALTGDVGEVDDLSIAEGRNIQEVGEGREVSHEAFRGDFLLEAVEDFAFLRFTSGDIIEIFGQEATLEHERVIRFEDDRIKQRFACNADDTLGATFRFANNAIGQYLRSWSGWGTMQSRRLALWGSRGTIDNDALCFEGKNRFRRGPIPTQIP